MPFPLGEWIDAHADCRYNLGKSGMSASIPAPLPSAGEVRRADENELRGRLADDLGVDPRRVFLTTGASAGNGLTMLFLARQRPGKSAGGCRVCYPEYPPLFETARAAGFRLTDAVGPVELAVLSQPRNPEGDLWDRTRILDWASDARSLLVDEEFREFARTRSILGTGRPGLWATGSFTKFYAGDDLRLGWVVAPEDRAHEFARFHGLVTNELTPFSVAGALHALDDRERIRRKVFAIFGANLTAARRSFPHGRSVRAPVLFDRPESGERGDSLADRALRASVLVCSGSFFGDPTGVRLCLTRRSFPTDLEAYLAVRDRRPADRRRGPHPRTVRGRAARPPPEGSDRAKGARS